jgi:sigma-B regulation protein RsbU (phosphoserine phosphatase)
MESRDASRFVTAVCGVLDQASGRFTYVNCGHNPPLLLRASGRAETLLRGGPALGIFSDGGFEAGSVSLDRGDSLLLFTDGVVEPADGRDVEFGVERLEGAVRAAAGRPAAEALRSVIDATRAFSGRDEYDDDFTLVVVNRQAAAP